MRPLVAIVGPTAVGKSALALELAEAVPLEVVNADSRQVYRGMDVGTAKPSLEARARVRHHLIDIVAPDQEFSLALFLQQARSIIPDIQERGRLPVVVGGTGQYVWGLLEGWRAAPVSPDPLLRARLEEQAQHEGAAALHARLRRLDPEAAAQIDPRNVRRVVRALEVCCKTGVPFSQQKGRGGLLPNALIIGLTLPREELYRRIDARVDAMLVAGWPEEVRGLLARGYGPELPAMSSVGYRELARYLSEELSWDEAVRRIKVGTRRLARRQYAWFRLRDPRIHWLDASANVTDRVLALVRGVTAEPAAGYTQTIKT